MLNFQTIYVKEAYVGVLGKECFFPQLIII
jgi:hypothetical protein